ncbi:MAG: MBL fold metallo-hydrolase [Vicingaceae bacterium]|nr:MAG: MBL fold metallo-hydrolase [Vicingaceae bacterium]
MQKPFLQFLGAAETVTGSKFLLSFPESRILIDCGLFQGVKKLRNLNWLVPPVDLSTIQYIIITHAHLDHVGMIPRWVMQGFAGKIFMTGPTEELAKIVLEDSAKIQMEEAEHINKIGYSKHKPALPLYDLKDVKYSYQYFHVVSIDKWITLSPGLRFRYRYAGHILGACWVEIDYHGETFIFSGDLGRYNNNLMYSPVSPDSCDVLVMESTYGNKQHPPLKSAEKKLLHLINQTYQREGNVIIPSFAVERTQDLMYILWKAQKEKKIPPVPLIMDSPMGKSAMDVFINFPEWHKLDLKLCREICQTFEIVGDIRDTYRIMDDPRPKIVIAGSGMITGGRVLFYLQRYIEQKNNTVILVGYQAEGTRGRRLLEGEKQLKIFDQYYQVNAKVYQLDGLSAHADSTELMKWLAGIKQKPKKIFLVHGETGPLDALRQKIEEKWPDIDVEIPSLFSTYPLNY